MKKHANHSQKKRLRFSQVMITKNEEANIERALSWGKEIFDEQIVVDTGSTDRTVEIAKRLGARVVFFAWINDFAAAKNYAIEQATGDWICILDADEYFTEDQAKRIPDLIRMADESGNEILETYVVNLDGQNGIINKHLGLRIIKNEKELRYHGAIHEELGRSDGRSANVFCLIEKLCFMHTGYAEEIYRKKQESNRNYLLIKSRLDENPDDPNMWGYLGDDLFGRKKIEEAEAAYKKAIELYPEEIPAYSQRAKWTFTSILRVLCELSKEDELYDYYHAAKSVFPGEADFDFIVGRYCFFCSNYEQAVDHLTACIALLEADTHYDSGNYAAANLSSIYEALSFSYYYTEDSKEAIRYASVILNTNHDSIPGISVFMMCFKKLDGDREENAAYCLHALSKFENLSVLEDAVHMSLAAKRTAYAEMQKLLDEKIPEEIKEEMRQFRK
uniref:glycosyltransferase family 2 protein n=1 Tax=Eubacterium cellulosolvens TaxID=29322 RepID=UPI000688D8BB|nr:glycosyltransferase family 2 protein [[Eubacterium] cellulosolvens]